MKSRKHSINIVVDKLINSIQNRVTGDIFTTQVIKTSQADIERISDEWNFNWREESKQLTIYKLVINENIDIIQGLISLSEADDHIFIELIESAPFNIGKNKVYEGVAGNLFAFACKHSFDSGLNGYVSFYAKSSLLKHYEQTAGAKRIGNSSLMFIDTEQANALINKYL